MQKQKKVPFISLVMFGVLFVFLIAGCGKRKWPSPNVSSERFFWEKVEYTRKQGCLYINATLKGEIENLEKVVIELQSLDSICSSCPFEDSQVLSVYSDYSGKNTESNFNFQYCELEDNIYYKFRLKGINKYSELRCTTSQVFSVAK